jgi:hypothetical protein
MSVVKDDVCFSVHCQLILDSFELGQFSLIEVVLAARSCLEEIVAMCLGRSTACCISTKVIALGIACDVRKCTYSSADTL